MGAQRRLKEVSELSLMERDGLRIRKRVLPLLSIKKDTSTKVLA